MAKTHDPRICEGGGRGLILPLTQSEQDLHIAVRGGMYGGGLVYCFIGVSIVADTFMGAIEAVTNQRRQVVLKNGRVHTARVWNDTVANLTLMALGSSAPEIMLSCIELLKNEFYAGELGPSTIVGSAAFNLLMIVAVCIISIPNGEARKIRVLSVFYVTMVFSVLAYLWLVVILTVFSPDTVDVFEAVVTLLLLPLLVWVSYLADTGRLNGLFTKKLKIQLPNGTTLGVDVYVGKLCHAMGYSDDETMEEVKKIIQTNPAMRSIDPESKMQLKELETIVTGNKQRCKSRAARRMEVSKSFTGRRDPNAKESGKDSEKTGNGSSLGTTSTPAAGEGDVVVEFLCNEQCFSKDVARKPIVVTRTGEASQLTDVKWSIHLYREENGQRVMVDKEVHIGLLSFQPDTDRANLYVTRPCVQPGSCEDFAVRLRSVEAGSGLSAHIGRTSVTNVTVCPPCSAGRLVFATERMEVPGLAERRSAEVLVLRVDGCSGAVSCNYRTEQFSSVPGYDYEEDEGLLEFDAGVTEKAIELTILRKGNFEETDQFFVVLDEPNGGVEFDPTDDGGAESAIFTMTILSRANDRSLKTIFLRGFDRWLNIDILRKANWDWIDQFPAAFFCNGDSEAQKEATKLDWVFHIFFLPWKLLVTLVPPTGYCGGWVRFTASLVFISGVTAIIGDLAELFGCVFEVPDSVTAITFVALGTSMPDLFASQTAAAQDPWADASICNVTGSNSVNVFLGLGLPWTMAAVYWSLGEWDEEWAATYKVQIEAHNIAAPIFVVPAASLGFSVTIFCVGALVALVVLNLRRSVLGAELGGPQVPKVMSAVTFTVLWASYVTLASWEVLRGKEAKFTETLVMILVPFSIISICVGVTIWATYKERGWTPESQEDTTDGVGGDSAVVDLVEPMSLEDMVSLSLAQLDPVKTRDEPSFIESIAADTTSAEPGQGDAGAGPPTSADVEQFTTGDLGGGRLAVKSDEPSVSDAPEQTASDNEQTSGRNLIDVVPPLNLTDVATVTDGDTVKLNNGSRKQDQWPKKGAVGAGALVNFPNATRGTSTLRDHEAGQWCPGKSHADIASSNAVAPSKTPTGGTNPNGLPSGVAQMPRPSVVRGGTARPVHQVVNDAVGHTTAPAAAGSPKASLQL
eukprot:TRINITY_DN11417_c0_g1_i1.p1 TRINITY_DN11417_c0_g1~~TRINITY_DN11417_c0_g1_i1.p1  ORF type:complete len:1139 (+),score=181.25 TRINITY_DN11417_c0_g1_i1:127-3543(+)